MKTKPVDRVQAFLYTLMRDELTPGVVAAIMKYHVEKSEGQKVNYSNKYIAAYAKELALELCKK